MFIIVFILPLPLSSLENITASTLPLPLSQSKNIIIFLSSILINSFTLQIFISQSQIDTGIKRVCKLNSVSSLNTSSPITPWLLCNQDFFLTVFKEFSELVECSPDARQYQRRPIQPIYIFIFQIIKYPFDIKYLFYPKKLII